MTPPAQPGGVGLGVGVLLGEVDGRLEVEDGRGTTPLDDDRGPGVELVGDVFVGAGLVGADVGDAEPVGADPVGAGVDAGRDVVGAAGAGRWAFDRVWSGRSRKYTTTDSTKMAVSTTVDGRAGTWARHHSRIDPRPSLVGVDGRAGGDALTQQGAGDARPQ